MFRTRSKQGRFVAISSEDSFYSETEISPGVTTLYANAISWLTGDKADAKIAARETVSTFVAPDAVSDVAVSDLAAENPDVYVIGMKLKKDSNAFTDADISGIVDYVTNGGSVIYAANEFDNRFLPICQNSLTTTIESSSLSCLGLPLSHCFFLILSL